jgi:carbamoyl-phosphate synthase large subunit
MLAAGPNVLITSVARKVALVDAFRAALAERNEGGMVIAVDVDPRSAALYAADVSLLVPRSDDPGFIPAMVSLCQRHSVGLLVPTRDEELPVFAGARDQFGAVGTTVLVPSASAVAACQDKLAFVVRCEEHGIPVPRRFVAPSQADFPLFARPRWGKGGVGAAEIRDTAELQVVSGRSGELILQEVVRAPEYTIDLVSDFAGHVLSVVTRERQVISAGESVVGVTRHVPALRDESVRLAAAFGITGHATIQSFFREGSPLFIEVNPRVGGASVLSFAAGASTPRMILRLINGEVVEPHLDDWEDGLVMLRHSTDIYLRGSQLTTQRWPE